MRCRPDGSILIYFQRLKQVHMARFNWLRSTTGKNNSKMFILLSENYLKQYSFVLKNNETKKTTEKFDETKQRKQPGEFSK